MQSLTHSFEVQLDGRVVSVPVRLDVLQEQGAEEKELPVGLVLAHGAGGDMDSQNMRDYARRLAARGLPVLTFTTSSSSVPFRARVMEAVVRAACEWGSSSRIRSWMLAGHSMGARAAVEVAHAWGQASAATASAATAATAGGGAAGAAASEPAAGKSAAAGEGSGRRKRKAEEATEAPVGKAKTAKRTGGGGGAAAAAAPPARWLPGMVLFSFPLHSPGRPGELRDQTLRLLQQPVLLLRGSRDPFLTDGPFNALQEAMGDRLQVHVVEGAGHTFVTKSSRKGKGEAKGKGKSKGKGKDEGEDDVGEAEAAGGSGGGGVGGVLGGALDRVAGFCKDLAGAGPSGAKG